ncbi:hypothetical protein GOODEAATRI_000155 [Goodea atripinnis]|uniref:RIMB1/RIM3A-C-like N-terminal domain-containing protein n=1 Tax=Goodea atripinnis TaxID=208336 RepID=A0ABV0PA52_9TELE
MKTADLGSASFSESLPKILEPECVTNPETATLTGAVEQYKRAFARQRARDLAQHADALLSKDKEIAALQQECRHLEARLGPAKDFPVQSARVEYEKLLRESQKEVLRLQRQLSVTSSRQQHGLRPDADVPEKCEENAKETRQEKVEHLTINFILAPAGS